MRKKLSSSFLVSHILPHVMKESAYMLIRSSIEENKSGSKKN